MKKEKQKILTSTLIESTNLGIQFAVFVFLFGYLGYYLDSKFDKEPWFMIIFGAIGFVLGFINIVRKAR